MRIASAKAVSRAHRGLSAGRPAARSAARIAHAHACLSVPRAARLCLLAGLLLAPSGGAVAVDYVVQGYAIPEPLTALPGDPARGAEIVIDRARGNCLGCHAIPVEAEFFGTTGPSLAAVGARLSAGELRLRLVDPKVVNPMTMMPAYHKTAGLHRVAPEYAGKPVLGAQEIEDVVAFLRTLR